MQDNDEKPGSRPLKRWLKQRQINALNGAYRAAMEIKALEEKYFAGGKIRYGAGQNKTVTDYVRQLCDRQLLTIRFNLAQFQALGVILNPRPEPPINQDEQGLSSPGSSTTDAYLAPESLTILTFVDTVIAPYRQLDSGDFDLNSTASSDDLSGPLSGSDATRDQDNDVEAEHQKRLSIFNKIDASDWAIGQANAASFLDRLTPFRKDLTPEYEQQVVMELRQRRLQNRIALRWLLILVLIPILVQILAKNLVFDPILGTYSDRRPSMIELREDIEEEFFERFSQAKEKLEISELLGIVPAMEAEEKAQRLEETAVELWRESREEALNGLKNIMADGVALMAFAGLVFTNRRKISVIRSFSNRTFLNLRDPIKVFLFILITDLFVGFHSAEGWEVILEGVIHHFGLPESKVLVNGFIATVPVIIDSFIKLWIFIYLTRYSPSASAIYERMNT